MIDIIYVPIYMKINHIFFVIKGQFPVMDYIPNTIILYFIVHCIYVSCLFYSITCLRLSPTPPVSGLRCIVFNKVIFCSVLLEYTGFKYFIIIPIAKNVQYFFVLEIKGYNRNDIVDV